MALDVIIIGAGPAGLAAAVKADQIGLSAMLIDEQPAPGGQIYRGIERLHREGRDAAFGKDYAAGFALVEQLRSSRVEYRPATQVWQVEKGFTVFASTNGRSFAVSARAVILAVGATERPVPIPGWTLPGVMSVGAAQILLKTGAVVPENPFFIAGQGPLPLLYAAQAIEAGARPAAILDTTPAGAAWRGLKHLPAALMNWRYLLKGLDYIATIRSAGVPIIRNVTEISALGTDRLNAIRYVSAGKAVEVPAHVLLLHEGVVPHVHMSLALGARHEWDESLAAPVPALDPWLETSLSGLFIAGDAGGIGGAKLATVKGERAAIGVLQKLRGLDPAELLATDRNLNREANKHQRIRPFLNAVFRPRDAILAPADEVIVCRCEEISAKTVRKAVADGCLGNNQVKSFTRCGMGPCQGRQCALTLHHVVAEARGVAAASLEPLRIRPPLKPLTLGELASLAAEGETAS